MSSISIFNFVLTDGNSNATYLEKLLHNILQVSHFSVTTTYVVTPLHIKSARQLRASLGQLRASFRYFRYRQIAIKQGNVLTVLSYLHSNIYIIDIYYALLSLYYYCSIVVSVYHLNTSVIIVLLTLRPPQEMTEAFRQTNFLSIIVL